MMISSSYVWGWAECEVVTGWTVVWMRKHSFLSYAHPSGLLPNVKAPKSLLIRPNAYRLDRAGDDCGNVDWQDFVAVLPSCLGKQ